MRKILMGKETIITQDNCSVDSRDVEDYFDKKTKKNKRKIKVTHICDLGSAVVPSTPLTRKVLEDMIRTEMIKIKIIKAGK